jgi:nucleotide-binding universal stress UspA family protein
MTPDSPTGAASDASMELLIPLDGSPEARAALRTGVALARAAGARVHLLRVTVSPEVAGSGLGAARDPVAAQAEVQVRADAADDLARLAVRMGADAGVRTVAVLDTAPDAAAAILAHARARRAAAIVLATRGAGGAVAVGRTADRVLRESDVPVLLVPPAATGRRDESLADTRVARVVVPLDGTAFTARVLDVVCPLVRAAAYTLVEVRAPRADVAWDELTAGWAWDPPGIARLRVEAERLHRTEGVDAEAVVLTDRDVPGAVAAFARERGADLVAMVTRGPRAEPAAAVGRVTAGVVRASTLPVLVVPFEAVASARDAVRTLRQAR